MTGVRVTVTGVERLKGKFRQIPIDANNLIGKAIATSALEVQSHAQRSIQRAPRGGEPYVRYAPRREGVASAPGETPATDTGRLVSSVFAQIQPLSAEVGTDVDYGTHLEFGTVKMGARPWLHPAFEALKKRIRERILRAAEAANRRAARKK